MNKRVYGVLGISSKMANWNADFTGYPKSKTSGEVFGSDKAFKYPMKKMWNDEGEKVLFIKSLTINEKGELIPRQLKERYCSIFGIKKDAKLTDAKEVLTNLFSTIDVKNFGATFAESGINISITGAVQFGQGFNKYKETTSEEQPILSPFRDSKDSDSSAKNSTIGTKIVSDEAHYFYSFSINPLAYKEYVELGVTDGYTDEDYKKFKEKSMIAATAYDTNSKAGCDNEFALFIETKTDVYLPNLAEYITFEKGLDDKNTINLNFASILNELKDGIESIEIYYNPITTTIYSEIDDVAMFDIFTKKRI